MMACGF